MLGHTVNTSRQNGDLKLRHLTPEYTDLTFTLFDTSEDFKEVTACTTDS